MSDPMPHYTKEILPEFGWSLYRKKALTRATRLHGPFTVETREGTLTCANGYLAIDSQGWPYPIAYDEFETIYEAS